MSLSLGLAPGYINNIENKHNLPSMTVFFYICEYLKVTPTEFFDFEVELPNKMNDAIQNLRKLNRSDFEHISSIIESLARK
jgi:transcriptional regulator with XRE-family HTH domain